MNIKTNIVRRASFGVAAMAVALASLFPALTQLVNADQVSSRSIEMSDSTPSHANTKYTFSFTPATTGAQSLVIDFCTNSSIIGGACTAASSGGMSVSSAALTTPTGPVANWQLATPSGSTLKLTKNTGSALTTSAVTFEVTGITNPSATGTFWARLYTYPDTTYGTYDTADSTGGHTGPGNYVDYGGFALSTTSLINISATVMETLTFCVNKAQPGNGCTSLVTPVNLTLGHGTPRILDSSVVDTDDAYFQVSTNALNGISVAMKSHNTCNGLSRNGGVDNCPIPGIGDSSATPAAATADFGMHITSVAGGTGTLTTAAKYTDSTSTAYGMGTAATSDYGDPIVTSSGALSNVNSHMTFAAQASVTTPAGVYTAAESLIATGTF